MTITTVAPFAVGETVQRKGEPDGTIFTVAKVWQVDPSMAATYGWPDPHNAWKVSVRVGAEDFIDTPVGRFYRSGMADAAHNYEPTYATRCARATTAQGLDPLIAALTEQHLDHTVEQTGGWCMAVTIPVGDKVVAVTHDADAPTPWLVGRYKAAVWAGESDEDDGLAEAEYETQDIQHVILTVRAYQTAHLASYVAEHEPKLTREDRCFVCDGIALDGDEPGFTYMDNGVAVPNCSEACATAFYAADETGAT